MKINRLTQPHLTDNGYVAYGLHPINGLIRLTWYGGLDYKSLKDHEADEMEIIE